MKSQFPALAKSMTGFGIVSNNLAFRVLDANMRRIFFLALALEVLLHLVYVVATRRPRRPEHPAAFRASPDLHARRLNPDHLSHAHTNFPGLVISPMVWRFLSLMKVN